MPACYVATGVRSACLPAALLGVSFLLPTGVWAACLPAAWLLGFSLDEAFPPTIDVWAACFPAVCVG